MRLERSVLWAIFVSLASVFLALPAGAAPTPTPTPPPSLDNASCLTCHDGKKGKLEIPGTDGKARTLRSVAADKFGQSVHANMQCVACHTDIVDNAEKANAHAKDPAQALKKALTAPGFLSETPIFPASSPALS